MRSRMLMVLGLGLSLQGCLRAPSLEPLRQDLQSQMHQTRFNKQMKLTLGPITLLMARTLCRLVPDREVQEARRLLGQIHRVEVAVYEVESPEGLSSRAMPTRLQSMLTKGDWQLAVRSQEDSTRTWILYRERNGSVRDFYVVTLDDEELVMVRVAGNMKRLVTQAMGDDGFFGRKKRKKPEFTETAETADIARK